MPDELVLLNGTVYTLEPSRPRATAVAVRGGRIVHVGHDADARGALSGRAVVVDLEGRCVVPGLADAHLHLLSFGRSLLTVDVEAPTLAEALERVRSRAEGTPPGRWILGRGWNHNVWGGDFPTAADLDAVAPHHPVRLSTKSGHASWVNTRALEIAGITGSTPDPEGGKILRDALGRPSGVLLEGAAMDLVERHVPEPSPQEDVEALRLALAAAARAGLTQVHDMDGVSSFRAAQVLREPGELALRVVKSVPLKHLDEAIALGLRTGLGDDALRIGQVKMFSDGALGPRTALMLEPFETAPTSTGIRATPYDVLRDAALRANAAGLGCAIHAIGDRACREMLDVLAEAQRLHPGRRNRIEHLQILHPDDVARVGTLGVVASMQPIHATSDMEISERHLGPRARGAYAFRSLLEAGAVLAFGSDCPVEPIDPLAGLHAAVTRRRPDGSPGPEGWHPEERLSVEEALRAFTWGAAYAAEREDRLGTIAAGKLADLTVLDQDVFAIDPMEIPHVVVVGTIVGGEFAYRDASL